jgi:putative DNA primase/helicase
MNDSTLGFSSGQVEILAARGITPGDAYAAGVVPVHELAQLPEGAPEYWTADADTDGRAYLPGLLFTWRSPVTDEVELQLRPDRPPLGDDGRPRKYVFRKGARSMVHAARVLDDPDVVLVTEGTCQTLCAALAAPDGVSVLGIAGCQSWQKHGVPTGDLAAVEGRPVLVVLDTDAATNRDVYDAGVKLRAALLAEGASSVRFIRVPGGAKAGLDDVLAGREPAKRTEYLARLIQLAQDAKAASKPEAPAERRPPARKPEPTDGAFFADGGLQVATLAMDIGSHHPAALTAEDKVAVYRGGVFVLDGTGILSAVTERLGEAFRVAHASNVERYMVGELARADWRLPDRISEPLLNLTNGMLDLRTLELKPHDAKYLSSVQLPVAWDPGAKAPVYEAWLASQAGEQAADLEEATSMMLDPTRTPTKAVFLFGPARSGKSTWLRIMKEIAGARNTSGVTLHQLSDDTFAAANVYGKVLNVAGDLSAAHVEDLSMFKRLTGEDLISANRKYGGQFTFTNGALFAFSANDLPTVGENSRAYAERIKPFHFSKSFAGAEDPSLEAAMLAELPGILVRWVTAYRARVERGRELATVPAVRAAFEIASDKVRQFVSTCCTVLPDDSGEGSTTTQLYAAFKDWTTDEGLKGLGKTKFGMRLGSAPGVVEVRIGQKRARGWNLAIRARQSWDEGVTVEGSRAVRAEFTNKKDLEDSYASKGSSESVNPVSRRNRPTVPGVPGVTNNRRSAADSLLAESAHETAQACTECGAALELLDMTWMACPSCEPGTVASRPGW